MARTAAALVIGNELLSGKIQDTNSHDLACFLRSLGVVLARIVTVPDDLSVIAAALGELRARFDLVFTSGGIGPTHDDVTIEAVALALGRATRRDESMQRALRHYYGDRCTEDHLRMATVVEGTELYFGEDGRAPWPVMTLGSMYLLPGVPQLFRMHLDLLRSRLAGDEPRFVLASVYCRADEGLLKPHIDAVVQRFSDVSVGSYPRWFDEEFSVRITFDGVTAPRVGEAVDALIERIPPSWLVRVERG